MTVPPLLLIVVSPGGSGGVGMDGDVDGVSPIGGAVVGSGDVVGSSLVSTGSSSVSSSPPLEGLSLSDDDCSGAGQFGNMSMTLVNSNINSVNSITTTAATGIMIASSLVPPPFFAGGGLPGGV